MNPDVFAEKDVGDEVHHACVNCSSSSLGLVPFTCIVEETLEDVDKDNNGVTIPTQDKHRLVDVSGSDTARVFECEECNSRLVYVVDEDNPPGNVIRL